MSNLSGGTEKDNEQHTLLCKKLVMKPSSVKCKLLVWNVWSIANDEKLNNFLQILDDQNISIACVTETWFGSENGTFSKTIKDAGFKLNHAFRTEKRGGGCAILYRKNLSVKKGNASSSEFDSFEYSVVTLTIKAGQKLVIICIYRKQEIQYCLFENELASLLDKLIKEGNMLCVVGDFNVWVDVDGNQEAEALCELMSSYGMLQNVSEPTHREGHTLDQVYINPYQLNIHLSVMNEPLGFTSDHFPIIVQIPNMNSTNTTETVFYRKLKGIDLEGFKKDLELEIDSMNSEQMSFAEHILELDKVSLRLMDKLHHLFHGIRKVMVHHGWIRNTRKIEH